MFDEVTQELSAEKVVTISKVLLLIESIQENLDAIEINEPNEPDESDDADESDELDESDKSEKIDELADLKEMLVILKDKFSSRTLKYKSNIIVAEATFLDPRFKKYGFPDVETFNKTERDITTQASK